MDGMSLLDVLRGVMLDPAEQAVYDADPGAYLEQYGYQDVDPADLSEAFGLVADTLPVDQARAAWTGESGPEAPALGADTADFDDGGADDAPPGGFGEDAVDGFDEDSPVVDDDTGDGDEGGQGDTVLSFGEGEAGDASDAGMDDGLGDEGLFGTAAPDGAPDAHGLDDLDADDAAFEGFTTGADDGLDGLDELAGGVDHDVDDIDDSGDLAEIDGFGPVDYGPDDLDIGSF
jgi:hypothetical protein